MKYWRVVTTWGTWDLCLYISRDTLVCSTFMESVLSQWGQGFNERAMSVAGPGSVWGSERSYHSPSSAGCASVDSWLCFQQTPACWCPSDGLYISSSARRWLAPHTWEEKDRTCILNMINNGKLAYIYCCMLFYKNIK